ncbi:MAG TPA: response regulator [Azospirillaceae bacterium]|nr:response regulator [Azospirillaceae bacterium]
MSKLRLLVAEDEAIIALSLVDILLDAGHAVAGIASTAEEAIALAARHKPDLALLDVFLARGSDGRTAAKHLQSDMGIPSILVTAHLGAQEAKATGALGLVPKPYTQDAILTIVAQAHALLRNPDGGTRATFITSGLRPGEMLDRSRPQSTV